MSNQPTPDAFKISVTPAGTGSVRLLEGFRVVIERKATGNWAAIQTQCFMDGKKRQRVLATSRFYDKRFVIETLISELALFLVVNRNGFSQVGHSFSAYWESLLSTGRGEARLLVDNFPIEQWVSLIKPDMVEEDIRPQALQEARAAEDDEDQAPHCTTLFVPNSLFPNADDGRLYELRHLKPGQSRLTLGIWHKMTLILERCPGFLRLSLSCYIRKGAAKQKVIAISHRDTLRDAQANLREFIAVYVRAGNSIPADLVRRLPLEQWLMVLKQDGSVPNNGDGPPVIRSPGLKQKDQTLMRWRIAPNVTLSFSELVAKPALMVFYRTDSSGQRNERIRIGTAGSTTLTDTVEALTTAIMQTLSSPAVFARCFSEGCLIRGSDLQGVLRMQPEAARTAIILMLSQQPIEQYMRFYDAATLPLRLSTHRKRLYPEMDISMRWISRAGPDTHSARLPCWIVLVGESTQTAVGKTFEWARPTDCESVEEVAARALIDAKAWRDEQEALVYGTGANQPLWLNPICA